MKNKHFTGCLLLLAILPFLSITGEAQTIARQNIGIYGAAGTIENAGIISQTIGQPYSTITYNEGGIRINPGFQQSAYLGNLKNTQNDLEDKKSSNKDFQELKIYPNPARDIIHIETVIERGSLQVFNMKGKKILSKEISYSGSDPIHCRDWANGLYMILVFDKANQANYSTKVLISK
ncbi:MAG: T9SS type A sorting domain-containing protein [Bacteroidales bacterium]